MTRPPLFLSVNHVLTIHARMIREFGGDAGLFDRGLLESAVAMPTAQVGGQYLHDGPEAMAGAYLFHLCQNHPFLDGNKRTALATSEVFLRLNGLALSAGDEEVVALTLGVADGHVSKAEVIEFFREHATASTS